MLRIVERERCGLIDRDGSCVGCRIGLLTRVELQRLEAMIGFLAIRTHGGSLEYDDG